MKFSESIIFSTLIGMASIGLITEQAQAITTFADATSANFDSLVGTLSTTNPVFNVNFDSDPAGPIPAGGQSFAEPSGLQVLTIGHSGLNGLSIATGTQLGLQAPQSGANQVITSIVDDGSATITFTFAEPTTYFGIHIGDQFDIGGLSSYSLTANDGSEIIFDNSSANSVISGGTSNVDFNDTAGTESLAVGNGDYNFFGIVDETESSPFTSITLDFSDGVQGQTTNKDNFAFDSIVIESQPMTPVPFEFSPALGLLLVGGLFGGSSYLKRKKAGKIDL